METIPGAAQYYPPPPPPQHSRKGLWIGLAIGAVVLCLCCIVIVVGVYFFDQNIPYISNFFPSPTPTGLFYNNPAAGISLTYPVTWPYSESGDATSGYTITFASSAELLNSTSSTPQTGAVMVVLTHGIKTSDLSFTVNASSMGDVADYIATSLFTNISQGQNLRTFTLSGYPAASGVYTNTNDTGGLATVYIITVLRNDEIILFLGVCAQTLWSQYQPTFDTIVNSASIVQP
ncbi:MAG: hypothetical protein WC832_07445 [Anaerolineales bacterium]